MSEENKRELPKLEALEAELERERYRKRYANVLRSTAFSLVVVAAVALVFRRIDTALYGVVALYISTLIMDWVLYGMDNAKVAYIISDRPEQIARVIMDDLDRTVTYLQGEGGYLGQPKKVILCAFKQRQIVDIKETVRQVDPNAFMIVTTSHEVLGEGFGSYHGNHL